VGKVSQEEIASWERLGEGGFSSVYKAKLKGNDVAIKVLKNLKETKSLLTEGNLLRYVLNCSLLVSSAKKKKKLSGQYTQAYNTRRNYIFLFMAL